MVGLKSGEAVEIRGREARTTVSSSRLTLILVIAALPACTVGPDYHPPTLALPGHWVEDFPADTRKVSDADALSDWWRGFHDERLNTLVERALRGNLDLQAADARVVAARAQRTSTAAGLWPEIDASSAYQRERLSPNALQGLFGGALGRAEGGQSSGFFSLLGPIGTPFNLFHAGFDSSWELDLFGGIKRMVEAAEANAEVIEESRRAIKVTLTAEVARNYFELISLQRRRQIANHRVDNQRKIYSLVDHSFQEGFATALDVQRARAEQEAVDAVLPTIEAQIKNIRHGLALLLGLQPGALERELANLPDDIPPPPAVPVGMPADLLRRRPDIRQAERSMAAATASQGAAVAELFPKIALTGAVGLQSQDLSNFTSLSSGFYGFGPRLSLPLFQAGRLLANIDVQEARTAEAIKAYEKTVLTAFREVEDALVSMNSEHPRKESLIAAESSARIAAESASTLYAEGENELQTVLDTNRLWYDLQDQLVQSELAWSTSHIALFKALGGGWH